MYERIYKSGVEKRKKLSAQKTELLSIPKLTTFFAQTPAVSSHFDDEEGTSEHIEPEQEAAVAEQSTATTSVVLSPADSAVPALHRLKSVDKDPANWRIIDDALREVIVS